jgi:hypothetical protein
VWTRRTLASSLAMLAATAANAQPAQQGQPEPPMQMEMTSPPPKKRTPAPPDAYLYIIWPQQGDRVRGAFWCRFGLRNMGVTHAGDAYANSGHHHLLVDVTEPLDPNEPIPTDKNHLHYGRGQTEARLDLPRGRHTLQLVLGDAHHRLFDPIVISRKITIEVV